MAIGTNCHNYCNSKSEHWLAVEIAIASQRLRSPSSQEKEPVFLYLVWTSFVSFIQAHSYEY